MTRNLSFGTSNVFCRVCAFSKVSELLLEELIECAETLLPMSDPEVSTMKVLTMNVLAK